MPPAPAYDHGGVTLITGDVRAVLPTLAAESVQTVVTSPPFFGLRSYLAGEHPDKALEMGGEPTPDDYVHELVAVFRDVRRVLRPDGTAWVELGDSYAGAGDSTHVRPGSSPDGPRAHRGAGPRDGLRAVAGYKPKDLLGMPWRVALALQADGWWLRSAVIWSKPNPMPESVGDRPTTAHSYVFLLAAGERYFYDAEAIAESAAYGYREGGMRSGAYLNNHAYLNSDMDYTKRTVGGGVGGTRNARTVWTIPPEPFPEAHFATFPQALAERCILAGSRPGDTVLDPFSGAGTVAVVAKRLERRAIGIELNPDYQAMAIRRLRQDVLPLFSHGRSADEPAAVVWHPGQGRLGEDDQLPAAGA